MGHVAQNRNNLANWPLVPILVLQPDGTHGHPVGGIIHQSDTLKFELHPAHRHLRVLTRPAHGFLNLKVDPSVRLFDVVHIDQQHSTLSILGTKVCQVFPKIRITFRLPYLQHMKPGGGRQRLRLLGGKLQRHRRAFIRAVQTDRIKPA